MSDMYDNLEIPVPPPYKAGPRLLANEGTRTFDDLTAAEKEVALDASRKSLIDHLCYVIPIRPNPDHSSQLEVGQELGPIDHDEYLDVVVNNMGSPSSIAWELAHRPTLRSQFDQWAEERARAVHYMGEL